MHLQANRENAIALMREGRKGPVVMLNLLRFRDTADYSGAPQLAPPDAITGRQAYDLYGAHSLPFLREAGGRVLYVGQAGPLVIGPSEEQWDRCLLVEHKDVETFFAFASNEGYLAGLGHRTAALLDSRLLPLSTALDRLGQ